MRAERLVQAPPERVWAVLNDVAAYADFMPHVAEAKVVAESGSRRFEYFRIKPPIIKQRDYTVQTTLHEDRAERRYSRRWHAANHQGPPPRADSIRLGLCSGSWTIEAASKGCSRIVYWVYTDPGGAIPAWLANRVGKRSIPDMLEAVARRAETAPAT